MNKYTIKEWAIFQGMTEDEIREYHGTDVIEFYEDGGAVAGCRHKDGTYDVFGALADRGNVTYEYMKNIIENSK